MSTRRQFLGQCAAGLALASGARLAAQTPPAYTYSGIRIAAATLCPEKYFDVAIYFNFNGSGLANRQLSGGPDSPACTIREQSSDFAAATGTWKIYFQMRNRIALNSRTEQIVLNDVRPGQTYPLELVTKDGRALRPARLTTSLAPPGAHSPRASYALHFKFE